MLKKIFKDPLIHFMVMGAVIFVFFSFSQDEASVTAENVIEITEEDIERLARMWQKSWMRPPTEAEASFRMVCGVGENVCGSWPFPTRTVLVTNSPPILSTNHFCGDIDTKVCRLAFA